MSDLDTLFEQAVRVGKVRRLSLNLIGSAGNRMWQCGAYQQSDEPILVRIEPAAAEAIRVTLYDLVQVEAEKAARQVDIEDLLA